MMAAPSRGCSGGDRPARRGRSPLGRVCAAWNGLRSVRHGRANDHGGVKCRTEWEPGGTLGLCRPRPRPPPPDRSPEAKQSQTADEQHKRRRHLHGVPQGVNGRLCADRRRGGEDQEQRQERARAPHVAATPSPDTVPHRASLAGRAVRGLLASFDELDAVTLVLEGARELEGFPPALLAIRDAVRFGAKQGERRRFGDRLGVVVDVVDYIVIAGGKRLIGG
jgi:hypothetical protein